MINQMRPAAIGFVGFIGLLIVFLAVAYVQLILLCLALIVCLMIIVGFLRIGAAPRTFWIPTRQKSEGTDAVPDQSAVVRIEGRSFSIDGLPERMEFTVRRRNLHLLAAMAIVASAAVVVCLFMTNPLRQQIEPNSARSWEFLGLSYLMVVLIFLSLAWLSECTLMRASGVTLANCGGSAVWVVYQFTDPSGGYHGGSTMNLGGPKGDHLKVVFCSPRNPEVNKLSCALLFHKVVWANQPHSKMTTSNPSPW
jgi:hypothetical protein